MRRTPRDFGYLTHTWTLDALSYHLSQLTEVRLLRERVRQLPLAHDFVCRRPKSIVKSPDPDKREKIARIARVLFSPGNYVVLFEDETELNTNPGIQRCWMPRGEQKEIITPGKSSRLKGSSVTDTSDASVTTAGRTAGMAVGSCAAAMSTIPRE